LADELRAAGLDVKIEPAVEWVERPSMPPKGFVLLQAEAVISVPGTGAEDLGAAISAVMFRLRGRVKLGPRRGEWRRVQIVDGHGNVARWRCRTTTTDRASRVRVA
jgi:hypothetical protein